MTQPVTEHLGQADIQFAGLSIWIHGRQFEDSDEYWDGNWLRATAHVGVAGSQVWASGPIIHLSELREWAAQLREVYDRASGEASVKCIEPNLAIEVRLRATGSGEARFEITPDHMREGHWFIQSIDQSYLPELIRSLEDVCQRFPIKGK